MAGKNFYESDAAQSVAAASPLSPSVRYALRHSSRSPVQAADLAARLLTSHPHYGGGRATATAKRLFELSKKAPNARQSTDDDWIEQTTPLFKSGVTITGRCVIVGLALLDSTVRTPLLRNGFLEGLAGELHDRHPPAREGLTQEALRAFENMLMLPDRGGGTDTLSDTPTDEDALGRKVFAEVLAARMRRLREVQPKSPLIIHLDGPWGCGKSTVLNFIATDLASDSDVRWLVVRYNAWQQQRIEHPWWLLSSLIAITGFRDFARRRCWLKWAHLVIRHVWFRTFAGRVSVLLAAAVSIAIGAALYSSIVGAPEAQKLEKIIIVATLIFSGILAGTRFFFGDRRYCTRISALAPRSHGSTCQAPREGTGGDTAAGSGSRR